MRLRTICIILMGLAILSEHSITARKKFKTLLFLKIDSNYNSDLVANYTTHVSSNKLSCDLELVFIKDLPADVWFQVSIVYRDPKSSEFKGVFSYNINMCSLLGKENANSLNVMTAWVSNLAKYSNMPKGCPFKAGHYYWRKLKPEKDSIPPFVLSGTYRVDSVFYLRDWKNAMLTNTSMTVMIKMK